MVNYEGKTSGMAIPLLNLLLVGIQPVEESELFWLS